MANLKYTGLEACHVYETGKILRASELTEDAKQSLSATRLILENLKGYYANYDTGSEEFLVNMDDEISDEHSELYLKLSKAIEYSIKGITESKTSENAFSKLEVGKYNNGDSYAKIFSKGTNCEYSILNDIDGIDISSKFESKIKSKLFISNDEFSLEKMYYSNDNAYSSLLSLSDTEINARVSSPEGPYVSTCLTYDKLQLQSSNDNTRNISIKGDRVVAEKYENQTYSFRTTVLGDAIYFGRLQHEIPNSNTEKIFFKLGMDEISWSEEEETYYEYFPNLQIKDDTYSNTYVNICKRTKEKFSEYVLQVGNYSDVMENMRSVQILPSFITFRKGNSTTSIRKEYFDRLTPKISQISNAFPVRVELQIRVDNNSSYDEHPEWLYFKFYAILMNPFDSSIESNNWASGLRSIMGRSLQISLDWFGEGYYMKHDQHTTSSAGYHRSDWQVDEIVLDDSSMNIQFYYYYHTIENVGLPSSPVFVPKVDRTVETVNSSRPGTIKVELLYNQNDFPNN